MAYYKKSSYKKKGTKGRKGGYKSGNTSRRRSTYRGKKSRSARAPVQTVKLVIEQVAPAPQLSPLGEVTPEPAKKAKF